MFLPMLMIDLREQFPKSKQRSQTVLSAVSQVLILYHISRESLSEIPLGQMASRLRYFGHGHQQSPRRTPKLMQLCKVVRSGKALFLRFTYDGACASGNEQNRYYLVLLSARNGSDGVIPALMWSLQA